MPLAQQHQNIRQDIDSHLENLIQSLPDYAPKLKEAMLYALTCGGKRMRPLLVHLVGEMLDTPFSDRQTISTAIECIHSYSLVHDDLPAMDDDDLRRGQPTCHIAFDEATAMLTGDALQTLAFTVLAEHTLSDYAHLQRAKMIGVLANASGYRGMCGGQAIDLDSTGKTVSLEALQQLHRLKTGALLRACVEITCIASDKLTPSQQQQLLTFAKCIGLAFQVKDDILDVTATTETLGKPKGSDEALGKSTFPSLLGLAGAQAELTKLHQESLQALQGLPYNTENLIAFADLMVNRSY